MATSFSIIAWEIPRTEEPGRDRGAWQAVFYGVSKKLDIKRPILSLFCSLHYEKKINYTIVQNI